MFDKYADEATFALSAVRAAASLCRVIQAELVEPAISKSDRSPVTVADYASQAVVARMFEETFPGALLVGEEDSSALQTPDQRVTLEAVTRFASAVYPEATREDVCRWIDL